MLGPKHFQEQNSLFQRSTLPQSIFKIKCQRNRISPVIGSIANGVREPLRRLHFFCGFTSYNHLHYNLLVVFKRNKNKKQTSTRTETKHWNKSNKRKQKAKIKQTKRRDIRISNVIDNLTPSTVALCWIQVNHSQKINKNWKAIYTRESAVVHSQAR